MCGSRGGGGTGGLDPPGKSQCYRVPKQYWSAGPWKITKLPSQHSMLLGHHNIFFFFIFQENVKEMTKSGSHLMGSTTGSEDSSVS